MKAFYFKNKHLLQAFSSEPSWQLGSPLQKSSLLMQSPLPQANLPASQIGSSVARSGATRRGSGKEKNLKVRIVLGKNHHHRC